MILIDKAIHVFEVELTVTECTFKVPLHMFYFIVLWLYSEPYKDNCDHVDILMCLESIIQLPETFNFVDIACVSYI